MSQTPFNFIAHFRAKPGSEQALEDTLIACVAPTRAEEGNVNYDLHRGQNDPTVFVIYEGWKVVTLWKRTSKRRTSKP
jgi:quinol monooxygenase YgiN